MKVTNEQQQITAAIQAVYPPAPQSPQQVLFTVKQFSIAQPAFTPASLRNLIFKADSRQSTIGEIKGNGLIECGAIIRMGRKVLIHSENFISWVLQGGDK